MSETNFFPRLRPWTVTYGMAQSSFGQTAIQSSFYNTECGVMVEAVGDGALSIVAEAIDTAHFLYRVLIKKRFYVEARAHLIRQQFKAIARTLEKRHITPEQLGLSLGVLCTSEKFWWFGGVGSIHLYTYLKGEFVAQYSNPNHTNLLPYTDEDALEAKIYHTSNWLKNVDTFVMVNKDVMAAVNEKQINGLVIDLNQKPEELAREIITFAQKRRKQAAYGVMVTMLTRPDV